MFGNNLVDQFNKDKLKQILNDPLLMTIRLPHRKKKNISCLTQGDSITIDENCILTKSNRSNYNNNNNYNNNINSNNNNNNNNKNNNNNNNNMSKNKSNKYTQFNSRKVSLIDVLSISERKQSYDTQRSPYSKQRWLCDNKTLYDTSKNKQQSFMQSLPQIQKNKSEVSQQAFDFKREDSSILTINNNEQLMDVQIERNQVLQNNLNMLSLKVLNMLNSLKSNDKMEEMVEELLLFLQKTSRTEIELSKIVNVSLKQSNEISNIRLKNQKLNDKIQFFQDKFLLTNSKNNDHQEKCLKCMKENNQQKKLIQIQKRKIDQLEQRIDFILQSEYLNDLQSTSNHSLRKVLTELVKENENLKRDNTKKDLESKRFIEQNGILNQKLNQMNQKIDSMKQKISTKDLEEIFYEQSKALENGNVNSYKDPHNILQSDKIPDKLDFRINQLKHEYKQLMIDLCEQGSHIFIEQYSMLEDQKKKRDWLKLILSQFLSYKEFSERNNKIFQMIHDLENISSFDDLLFSTNDYLKKILKCNSAHVWIYDQFTGILYTMKEDKSELRALNSKGVFCEIIRHQVAANKNEAEEFIVYEQIMQFSLMAGVQNTFKQKYANEKQENWVYSNAVLCIPLFSQSKKKQIIGIMEFSGSRSKIFSSDDEYCAVLLAQFMSNQITRIKANRQIVMQNRYKDFLQDAFLEFIQCKDKISFTNQVAIWLQRIFTVSQFRMYFVKDHKFYNYKNEEFTPKHGWAGHEGWRGYENECVLRYKEIKQILQDTEVLQQNQGVIVQNIKSSENYDPLVDMYSILPIQIKPLCHNNKILGIIEFPVKKCNRTASTQDDFTFSNSPLMGLDNSFDNAMKAFCKHLSIALHQNPID